MLLKKGDSGKEVKQLQILLNKYGHKLIVDGDFGDKTYHSVIAFQRANNLQVDGIVGKNTMAKLNELTTKPKPKPLYTAPKIQPAPRKINSALMNKDDVDYIFLHNSASVRDLTWQEIDNIHKNKGWAGIGYNFYIRKDGTIIAGRGLNQMGSHTFGFNSRSIGICFSGNFELENPTEEQIIAGNQLVQWLKYVVFKGKPKVLGHKDAHGLNSEATITACPGKHFPLDIFKKL